MRNPSPRQWHRNRGRAVARPSSYTRTRTTRGYRACSATSGGTTHRARGSPDTSRARGVMCRSFRAYKHHSARSAMRGRPVAVLKGSRRSGASRRGSTMRSTRAEPLRPVARLATGRRAPEWRSRYRGARAHIRHASSATRRGGKGLRGATSRPARRAIRSAPCGGRPRRPPPSASASVTRRTRAGGSPARVATR